jgi:hypothetical protein
VADSGPAAPSGSPLAQRAQVALAALLTAGSIAWSTDLFRAFGLVLFPEQFLAAIYGVCLALMFLRYPARRDTRKTSVPWYDFAWALVSLLVCGYVAVQFPELTALSGSVTAETLTISLILFIVTIEGVRRTIGYSLVIIVLVIAAYALLGHLVPGQLRTHEVDWKDSLIYLGLDTNGLLGLVLQITIVVVIPFVLMGQLLMRSHGSGFFNDIAIALMGRRRGGAAKIAVIGSSLFGMISGIAAANAVAVGVVTIPLMKKSGMPARLAGAVEACASNGGQLMPPVMGAVAFVMAEFLQLPYKAVAVAAILPSLLYYAALFIQADLEAARYGFGKVEEDQIPRVLPVLPPAGFSSSRSWCWWQRCFPERRTGALGDVRGGHHPGARLRRGLRRPPHEAERHLASRRRHRRRGVRDHRHFGRGRLHHGLVPGGRACIRVCRLSGRFGRTEPVCSARPFSRGVHHPRHGAAHARRVRDARHPGCAGAGEGGHRAARGACSSSTSA